MTWSMLLQRASVPLLALSQIDRVVGDHIGSEEELFFTFIRDRDIAHYIGVDQIELGERLQEQYFRTPEQIKEHYERGKGLIKEIEKESNNLDDLQKAYAMFRRQFEEVCYIFSITSWFAIEAWQERYEKIALRIAERSADKEQALVQLYRPWKKTALTRLQEELAAGAEPADLLEKYRFLRSWIPVWHPDVDEEWIESLRGTEKQETADVHLDVKDDERRYVEFAPYMVFFKDWRDDLRRRHAYEWQELFERIARQFRIETDELGYLTLDELERALADGEFPGSLVSRRKERAFILTANNRNVTVHEEIPAWCDRIVRKPTGSGRIAGWTAYPGIAHGHVRIVRNFDDACRLEEGEVLVSNTTHPEYLPAMKKAAAIITEAGGMISHAAIAAREMKKPCIVGTGNATRVLKNGDLLEVDATKGTVRKMR